MSWFLQDDSCAVFLDVKGITPGTLWPHALCEALEASRVIVVLVSAHIVETFYQQEEWSGQCSLHATSQGSHTVIPVILEKLPHDAVRMPYGMSGLQAPDATRAGGLKRVAAELVTWLKDHQRNTKQPQMANAMIEAFACDGRVQHLPF